MILAIDDDPERYQHLRRLLPKVDLMVHCCPGPVKDALQHPELRAILLDYDLDGLCSKHPGLKSDQLLLEIRAAKVPIIITSANFHARGYLHKRLLAEVGGVHAALALLPCTEPDPELKWVGQLYIWGAL